MKRTLSIMAAVVLAAGCTTTPTGQKVPDVAKMCRVAQGATELGTSGWLADHPNDRPAFEAAMNGVRALIAAGEFQPADLARALSGLPIKELKSGTGQMIVGGAILLWDVYGGDVMALDDTKKFETYILPVAKAILVGFENVLSPKPTGSIRIWTPELAPVDQAVQTLVRRID